MGIIWATNDELEWIAEQDQQVNFVPSKMGNEKIAIVTYKWKYAGVSKIVYLNEVAVEIGRIYILEAFRGLSLANEL